MSTQTFDVVGMTCGHCAHAVTEELKALDGVTDVQVELVAGGTTAVTVAADRGWQNTGLRLEQGARYRLTASGRYQVADQPQVWWCEPGGVSIRYYHGRPLGMLLAAVRDSNDGSDGFLRPLAVGLAAELTSPEGGTLYLRINDSAAELHDNAGELMVEVTSGG